MYERRQELNQILTTHGVCAVDLDLNPLLNGGLTQTFKYEKADNNVFGGIDSHVNSGDLL